MYAVSAAYLQKILSNTKVVTRRIRGTVGNIAFTENDIISSSFTITEKCVNSADINLGGVFVGQMDLTFCPAFAANVNRGDWRGKEIRCRIGLLVDPANDTWEDVPCKPYTIDSAMWSRDGVSVTAYDAMTKFDKTMGVKSTDGNVFALATLACRNCNVQLGMTQTEMQALPNGTELLSLYPENDIETWRDFISWIAVTIGGFATINRTGRLEFRTWHSSEDITMDVYDRATGGQWSDFVTYYTGVSITNIAEETTSYYGTTSDTGLTMNLGPNPLMQYGDETTKAERCRNILAALEAFDYTPFTSSGLLDPCLDLGDVIKYTDGLAGTYSMCCVHKIEFSYRKGVKITGFGKNPAMFGAKSKTDKNIAGLKKSTESGKDRISVIHYANATAVGIDEEWRQIAHLRIGVMQSQIAQLHGVIRLNMTDAGHVYVRYRVNGFYEPFIHVCQFPVGLDTITLFLPVNITNEQINEVVVEIMSTDGEGTVAVDNCHIVIQGVGVTAGVWDGYLEATDEYQFNIQEGIGFTYDDSTSSYSEGEPQRDNARDTYSFGVGSDGIAFGYTDIGRVVMDVAVNRILTEDGESTIITEDGANHIICD